MPMPIFFGQNQGIAGPAPPPTANLAFEWYADNESGSDGSSLTQLTDTSGNANHATQGTGANQAVLQHNSLGGRKTAFFDGAKNYTLTNPITATEITVYAVYRATAAASTYAIVGGNLADNALLLSENTSSGTGAPEIARFGTGTMLVASTSNRVTRWCQANFQRNNAGDIAIRLNRAASGTASATASPVGPFREIGARNGGSNKFNGQLSALLIYTGVHDTTTRQQVEDFLHDYFDEKIGSQRVLWARANDLALSGGASVNTFTDNSGHGNHFTLPSGFTAGTFQTAVLNGLAGVRLGTGSVGYESKLFLPSTAYSIYIVYNYRSLTSAGRRAIQGISNNWLIGPYNNKHQMFAGSFADGGALTQNVFVLGHCIGNSFRLNGTTIGSAGSNVPGFIGLGAKGAFAEPLDGDICEVIIEEEQNDSTEESTIKTYIASEYGLTIA